MPVRRIAITIALAATVLAASSRGHADVATASGRGAAVFSRYCALCHGRNGTGDGRAAALQAVPPANLTTSTRTRSYQVKIVRNGGRALNRSTSMPAWKQVLSEDEIADVVEYLQTLRAADSAGVSAASVSSAREVPQ